MMGACNLYYRAVGSAADIIVSARRVAQVAQDMLDSLQVYAHLYTDLVHDCSFGTCPGRSGGLGQGAHSLLRQDTQFVTVIAVFFPAHYHSLVRFRPRKLDNSLQH